MWTAASIALLLRARSQAELRRKEWEEWAVERHGSLQAAYSNPRVKVPKVEELLVEEWGQLKPTQAGMSAYSLNSYLKRFDTLKAELVGAQDEVRRRKEALKAPPPIQYQTLPQSDIPRYDLSLVSRMSKLPPELRRLIGTRQRAKLRAEAEGGRAAYTEVWSQLWHQETGQSTSGGLLRARLHQLMARASYRHRLSAALMPLSCPAADSQQPGEGKPAWECAAPPVPSRLTLFPDRRYAIMHIVPVNILCSIATSL